MTPPVPTRIGRVRLQVADLERSLGFYRDLIGFRVLEQGDGRARLGAHRPPSARSADPGEPADSGRPTRGSRVPMPSPDPALLELVERPGVRPVPRTGLMGIYHFALLLPERADLGRFVRRQVERGVRFGAADHAFSEALYLEDPDGMTIEVYRDRPRNEWPDPGPGGNLPLVSDPLDAAGLMASAGDEAWDGVPSSAVVGHMHFFVDDLEAAARFYVDGLGLERMISVPTALFVAAGGYHHHVGLNTWRAGAPTAGPDDARLLDWELVLPDAGSVESAAHRLEARGMDVHRHGREVQARDPWGIQVRITTGGGIGADPDRD